MSRKTIFASDSKLFLLICHRVSSHCVLYNLIDIAVYRCYGGEVKGNEGVVSEENGLSQGYGCREGVCAKSIINDEGLDPNDF